MAHDADPSRQAPWRRARWGPAIACLVAYGTALAAAIVVVDQAGHWSPLWTTLLATIAATIVIFIWTTALGNSSLYDSYWSVAPPLFLGYWILHPETDPGGGAREAIVMLLVLVWALRLTANCMLRWPNLASEDFRYRDLRARFGRFYPVIDLAGIQLFPTLLVFAGCLSLYVVADAGTSLGLLDIAAFVVTAGAIALETIADRQLRRFKLEVANSGQTLTSGVWAWSRHPNYLGELGFWWGLWLFAMAADPTRWWTIAGPVAMTALFVFISVPLMEGRKRRRHPEYEAAVAGIPALFPRWPRRR